MRADYRAAIVARSSIKNNGPGFSAILVDFISFISQFSLIVERNKANTATDFSFDS
ncbi:MAG: hypothetical protein PHP26_09945 [Syntrophomonas sp.]|uniref:hypothetical protein n=1 Tax=Syntrophomonas sp. TaxID=2053627 RepID=UPI0026090530|nr:hypothetical protein [Syntrophomonas sp.]MDD2510207.1 hypothetical protein [Syntrophomonas sp.]MDD3880289.1 hypothetical protein [Syntrophomonas sp.]